MKSCSLILVFIFAAAVAAQAQTPAVADGGVLNAGSYVKGQPVAPGSLVSIFGTGLASSTTLADTIPLSTSLGNVSVTFNNIKAPLLVVTSGQINAQLPVGVLAPGTQNGTAQVTVTNGSAISAPITFSVTAAAPGIFTALGNGLGQAIAYGNDDGLIAAPPGAIPGLNTHPAKIGNPATLVILATGLGPVNPPVTDGNNALDGQFHKTTTDPVVLIGNVPAQVAFSGLSPQFVGVYQINVVVAPGTPTGDAVPVQISMNGITTSNQVTIAVSQ